MENRWKIERNNAALSWNCQKHSEDHTDFIEMSGLYTSAVITYGIKERELFLHRHLVFPMLRIFPNNTHGSLQCDVQDHAVPKLFVNGVSMREHPESISLHNGFLDITSRCADLQVCRTLFPSPAKAALCEHILVVHTGKEPVTLSVSELGTK